ncbi:MAG: outer membrane protein assembly factor BamA [Deltaproteobacteria bacterium]|jgi:outer membrane protein insertion porin family|nr:outer membrane protein assembly factor BamA [Deltaproteobacteria bacterium]
MKAKNRRQKSWSLLFVQCCLVLLLLTVQFPLAAFTASTACAAQASASAPSAQVNAPDASSLGGPVMVLPFQINAGENMAALNIELPELIIQRLVARGLPVMSLDEIHALLERERITGLDLATVRRLMRRVGASAALYGSYSQLGDSFSIDSRLVHADPTEPARPLFVEQPASINLLIAVEELATRITGDLLRNSVISHIEVRGANILDPDVILLRINTKQGDVLDMRSIDNEFRRIWDLGFFSDIQVQVEETPDGLHLIYTVTEKPRVAAIVINGTAEIEREDVVAVMTTRVGAILNEKVLASDLQKIQELYRKEGYYLAKVTYAINNRDDGAGLTVNIEESNRLYIKEVRFEGVANLDESDITDELALSERHMFSWLTGSGVLKEELIERDVSVIGNYYMNNGFMDVAVGQPDIAFEEDGIVITHRVVEGPRYRVGTVRFAGELLDSDEEMAKIIQLDDAAEDNDYFGLDAMQDDVQKLTAYYAEYGYAYANVVPQPQPETYEDIPVMNITYAVEKRHKVYVRNIILEGNAHTRDNVVLREMRLTDGDPFNGARLARSMQRLNNTGYFDLAESELVPTGNPEEVDLKIKLQEANTGSVMAGVGYSTYSSFGVSGTVQEMNLWGKGYQLALQGTISGRRSAYDLSFTNPRLNDSLFSVGADLYHWDDDFYDYDKRTIGSRLRVGHPVGEYSYVFASYRMDFYNLSDFDDNASELIKAYEGNRMASVASLRFARSTVNRVQPTDGTSFYLEGEYGGGFLSGDDDFIKLVAEFQAYKKLADAHVLHMRVKGGALFENGSDSVPVYERFWMGGMESIRGYNSRDIVPRDPKTDDRLGGDRMAFMNLEYIWNFAPDSGLNLVPFFDIGFNLDSTNDYSYSDEILKSFGLELRWRSPMGDLRFSYGIPLDEDRKGDRDSGKFEFSMGQFF